MKLKSNLSAFFCFQSLVVAIRGEGGDGVVRLAMKDVVDGVVTGNVFDLSTAEIVFCGEGTDYTHSHQGALR